MNRSPFKAWISPLGRPATGSAQVAATSSEDRDRFGRVRSKQKTSDARAPEHYSSLAAYYGERHRKYLKEASDERVDWERRNQNVAGAPAKSIRQIDSAQNLFEYYMAQAAEAGKLEAKYSQLAAPDAFAKAR